MKFAARDFGPSKLTEKVGPCVGQQNFSPCQLLCFVPLEPSDDDTRHQDDGCNGRNGPACDPLQACRAGLRRRGAGLGCLYLGDLGLVTCEGFLFLLARGLFAR